MRGPLDIYQIEHALGVLAEAGARREEPDFWQLVEPLVEALRDGDTVAVVEALGRPQPVDLVKREARFRAWSIATQPEKYGADVMSKSDVLRVLEVEDPYLHSLVPQRKEELAAWWRSLDLEVGQARGNATREFEKGLALSQQHAEETLAEVRARMALEAAEEARAQAEEDAAVPDAPRADPEELEKALAYLNRSLGTPGEGE